MRKGEVGSADYYLASADYWASGAPASLRFGNRLVEETGLDSQGRVIRIAAKMDSIITPIVQTVLWQSELSDYSNGNIAGQNITGNHGGASLNYAQTYRYDKLNRLLGVTDSGLGTPVTDGTPEAMGQGPLGNKTQVIVYDRCGNRALKDQSVNPGGGVQVTTETEAAVEAVFPNNRTRVSIIWPETPRE